MPAARPADAPARVPNLLIVDDDPGTLQLLHRLLADFGEVFFACGGREAIDLLGRQEIDIVLLDAEMPDMDGFATCAAIRGERRLADLPIVFVTARTDIGSETRALALGAVDFISKPLSPPVVRARVAVHLSLKAGRDEIRGIHAQLENRLRELQAAYDELQETRLELLNSAGHASLGHLAAGVAHEINNPLGFILGNYQILAGNIGFLLDLVARYEAVETELPPAALQAVRQAKAADDLAFIRSDLPALLAESRSGLERVRDIVSQLRTFAHEQGTGWSDEDLGEVLDRALAVAAHTFPAGIPVHRSGRATAPIECCASELAQMFLAILINAGQAIDAAGSISIDLRRDAAGDYVVDIADSGCGIAPDRLPHIFDPFFTTREVGTGKGLGLTVAQHIARKHGGRIEASSVPGAGTRLAVHLPARRKRP